MQKSDFGLLAVFACLLVGVYMFHVGVSLLNRGEVTQDYWYCDVYMRDKENDVHPPHHRGHKPLIPFSDHLCGENELDLARRQGWDGEVK